MIDRRRLLRTGLLAASAVAGSPLLAGCAGGAGSDGTGTTGTRLVSADLGRAAADPDAVADAVTSVQALGGGLFSTLVGAGANLALSPSSAAVALGMAANGAAGRTQDQMLDVLHAADLDRLNSGLNALTQYVESLAGPVPHANGESVSLDAADRLFGQRGVTWRPAFLDTLKRSYGAGLREVDFEHDADGARTAINRWTADQTHDRIPQIIPAGVLDRLTRLVLVDTLYLKAPWVTPFETSETRTADFHLADGTTVGVPTMHGPGSAYGTRDGWRSARLGYANPGLVMTVVLPDPGRAADVEAVVAAGRLVDLLQVEGVVDIPLSLPRWTFRTATSLSGALSSLGMPDAFSTRLADFSAMTADEPLVLAQVLQQVFVSVDEAGTEAAAATAEVFEGMSGLADPPAPLVLDRPFLFCIHDVDHGTPLFLGRVADPRG